MPLNRNIAVIGSTIVTPFTDETRSLGEFVGSGAPASEVQE